MIHDKDQNTSDFQKVMRFCSEQYSLKNVIAVGGMDGRFDHAMMSIEVMQENRHQNLVLFNQQCIVFLLNPVQKVSKTHIFRAFLVYLSTKQFLGLYVGCFLLELRAASKAKV